ncbi:MAG: hypothetical protein KAK00_00900, partial [Nanoarchaeota archaeon]|nr:hypothetical protein [Nanoarchaeota archaeon]
MDKKGIKNKALSYLEQFRHLKSYLILAGIKLRPVQAFIILYVVTAIVDLSFLFYFVYLIVQYEVEFIFIIIVSFVMVTLGYVLIFMIVWLIFLVMI